MIGHAQHLIARVLAAIYYLYLFASSPVLGDFSYTNQIYPILEKYCFKCHGETKPKADVRLSSFPDLQSIFLNPKLWERVFATLHSREMPPDGKPQPSGEEYQQILEWLRQTLDNPDPNLVPPDPGIHLIHRLSHTEYNNTLRDLLGTTSRPADRFPSEGSGGAGFDNTAETLFVPPLLMEKLLAAAEEALAEAPLEQIVSQRRAWYRLEVFEARWNLLTFARRAFRRPIDSQEIAPYLQLFSETRRKKVSFVGSLKAAYQAILVSPYFLFRIEADNPNSGIRRLNSYELASRLSYFLWSSMPDAELFLAADRSELTNPVVLEMQVQRMLRDPKARALADNFASQWLGVRQFLQNAGPDPRQFPNYTPALRDALAAEPMEFFDALVRFNRNLLDLVDCNYAYVNPLLARHYGMVYVQGEGFRQVPLSDRTRGGVTGMGTMLIQTSYPLRTSPVLRGKWILEEILGTPPPPPPPLVATLPADDKAREGLTFRERLEEHRKDPNCAACHQRMDPLGFSLENFDATGRWRTEIDGKPVDASGTLVGGEKVAGPIELKNALLSKRALYFRHITELMMAYALGRGLEYYDMPTIRGIADRLNHGPSDMHTLILEITKSYPFLNRRALVDSNTSPTAVINPLRIKSSNPN